MDGLSRRLARSGTHPNTGTSLFDIDTALDQVVLQSPPNAGSLAATGKTTVDGKTDVGFDVVLVRGERAGPIEPWIRRRSGRGRFATEVTDIAVPLAQ